MHPKFERTFVILKPDSIQRGLVGEIITRFERIGLKIIAMKMINATEEQCWKHYQKNNEWYTQKGAKIIENYKSLGKAVNKEALEYGKDIIGALVKYMTASPVIAFLLEGNEARAVVKRLVGGTEPSTSDTGTIRGDYAFDSYNICDVDNRAVRNLIHCTDPADGEVEYIREAKIWFNSEEIIKYKLVTEVMLYDVNLDGIRE